MALAAYQLAVTNLIQAPTSPTPLISSAQLTTYINLARSKVATDGECVRVLGTLNMVSGTQQYSFAGINLGGAVGVAQVMTVRTINYAIAGGFRTILPRPWAWFNYYVLNDPTPVPGFPTIWVQYGQGLSGSLYFNIPDFAYPLTMDTVCIPVPLVDDNTDEAIPYPWTDAVEFYAAWLALLQLQRTAHAEQMYGRYTRMMGLASSEATPTILPNDYERVSDPTLANKLASQPLRTGADIGTGSVSGQPTPTG